VVNKVIVLKPQEGVRSLSVSKITMLGNVNLVNDLQVFLEVPQLRKRVVAVLAGVGSGASVLFEMIF
jgi:hypothetical protein